LKHAWFEKVYGEGRRIFSANITVFYRRRQEPPASGPRVGITVSRAMGGAVKRNRIRRRLREAVRMNLAALTAAVDIVINPKRTAETSDFRQLVGEVERAFVQIERKASTETKGAEGRAV
jgi:ribonuclease P protein component